MVANLSHMTQVGSSRPTAAASSLGCLQPSFLFRQNFWFTSFKAFWTLQQLQSFTSVLAASRVQIWSVLGGMQEDRLFPCQVRVCIVLGHIKPNQMYFLKFKIYEVNTFTQTTKSLHKRRKEEKKNFFRCSITESFKI